MRIVSILENQKVEKRIAITPDIAKKYIALGFEVTLSEKYGEHLGFKDDEYKELGVKFSHKDIDALSNANIIVQLGLLSDDNILILKEDQTLVGVFNPYINQEKIYIKNRMMVRHITILAGTYRPPPRPPSPLSPLPTHSKAPGLSSLPFLLLPSFLSCLLLLPYSCRGMCI